MVVADADLMTQIDQLGRSLESIEAVADMPRLRAEIARLAEEVAAPNLWDDQENAQRVTSTLSAKQAEVERLEALRGRLDDAAVMLELAAEENDAEVKTDVERELHRLAKEIETLEVRTLLSGEYDSRDALITIRAGGTSRLHRRGVRHVLCGRGRSEVCHLRCQGTFRLRHALGGAGYSSSRSDLSVR